MRGEKFSAFGHCIISWQVYVWVLSVWRRTWGMLDSRADSELFFHRMFLPQSPPHNISPLQDLETVVRLYGHCRD